MSRRLFLASLLVAMSSPARAFVTGFDLELVEETELPGFTTYDVTVTGTDELLGGTGLLNQLEMRFDTFDASIYQHPNGGNTPPSFGDILQSSLVQYDTFVTIADDIAFLARPFTIQGGATGLGGGSEVTFDESRLDIAWSPIVPVYAPNELVVARITVSEFTSGFLSLRGGALGEPDRLASLPLNIAVDPFISSTPEDGGIIALDDAIDNSGGVRADAIRLSPALLDEPAAVKSVSLADGTFFSAENVVGQTVSFDSDVWVDLMFHEPTGHGVAAGTIVTDTLTIDFEQFGLFQFTLAATVRVPEATSQILSMASIFAFGFLRPSKQSCFLTLLWPDARPTEAA